MGKSKMRPIHNLSPDYSVIDKDELMQLSSLLSQNDKYKNKEPILISLKIKGKFYTPKVLAEWIVFYLSSYFINEIDVLEPSCGNGVFINSLDNSNISINCFDAIELDKTAISNIIKPSNFKRPKVFNADFLYWETEKNMT